MSAWTSFSESRIPDIKNLSATDPPTSLNDARAKLDQEIEAVFATATALQNRRNALLPVARLHPEILAHIFLRLATDSDEIPRPRAPRAYDHNPRFGQRKGFAYNPYTTLGWIRATHVCHIWRAVALDTPALWGIDVCSLRGATEERMRRAKSAPLDVRWRGGATYADNMGAPVREDALLRTLLGALDHTRTLELLALSAYEISTVMPRLRASAPLLETFACASYRSMDPFDAFMLPADLFAGDAPRLTSLSLTALLLPLDCPLYAGIRNLSLISDTPPTWLNFAPGQILELFGRMPKLESLEMQQMIPRRTDDDGQTAALGAPSAEHASLPRLRRLKVVDIFPLCLWLLQSLTIPPSAAVLIECYEPTPVDAPRSLIPFIAPHTHEIDSTPPIVCISLRITVGGVHLECWRTRPDELFTLPPEGQLSQPKPADVSLDFRALDGTARQLDELLYDMLMELILDGITALRVSTTSVVLLDGSHFDLDWRGLFGRFKAVSHLTTGGAATPQLVSELYVNPFWRTDPELVDPAAPDWLFPNLRRLKIGQTKFWQVLKDYREEMCDVLRYVFKEARTCPVTDIQELLIEDCMIDVATVDELRCVVPTVSWDGHHTVIASEQDEDEDEEEEDEYEPTDGEDHGIDIADDYVGPDFPEESGEYQSVFASEYAGF
ncbi:hypothetical protein DENSPDRAFT_883471 [Dentipellis sp. KUC8613]|nr:hypothetical protein DENSPDRAFT_883471 [Dentipellis sp. KUC8613]